MFTKPLFIISINVEVKNFVIDNEWFVIIQGLIVGLSFKKIIFLCLKVHFSFIRTLFSSLNID